MAKHCSISKNTTYMGIMRVSTCHNILGMRESEGWGRTQSSNLVWGTNETPSQKMKQQGWEDGSADRSWWLFQRTQAQVPGLTWQLTTNYNSSARSKPYSGLLRHSAHTCKYNTHTLKANFLKNILKNKTTTKPKPNPRPTPHSLESNEQKNYKINEVFH